MNERSKLTVTAIGTESFDGCTDLTRHDNEKWFELGGVDVVVWGNEFEIFADEQAAIDYIAEIYELTIDD